MKYITRFICALAITFSLSLAAQAEVIGGMNWADSVVAYSANIQNYGFQMMNSATEFWVLNEPDADTNDNGYTWDDGEPDYVAGWRGGTEGEYIIVHFDTALTDVDGNDLNIFCYGGSSASCTVSVSNDGITYTDIGTIGAGTPGYLVNVGFDFDGLFADDPHYVKVLRVAKGSGTGMFFDAFGGAAVPEPGTMALLSIACVVGLFICARRRRQ